MAVEQDAEVGAELRAQQRHLVGLDLGSKIKFKGVVIGEVTKISFTYVVYQQDLPMLQRARYVLVESQIQPRLVGGRAAAGDLTDPANAKMEVERGLRESPRFWAIADGLGITRLWELRGYPPGCRRAGEADSLHLDCAGMAR